MGDITSANLDISVTKRDTVADMFRRCSKAGITTVDRAIGFYLQYFCIDEQAFLSEIYALGLDTEEAGNTSLADAIKKYLPNKKI